MSYQNRNQKKGNALYYGIAIIVIALIVYAGLNGAFNGLTTSSSNSNTNISGFTNTVICSTDNLTTLTCLLNERTGTFIVSAINPSSVNILQLPQQGIYEGSAPYIKRTINVGQIAENCYNNGGIGAVATQYSSGTSQTTDLVLTSIIQPTQNNVAGAVFNIVKNTSEQCLQIS